jgi:hypothetical protein
MVKATDVEDAVGHEQADLVGGRPADVPRLPASASGEWTPGRTVRSIRHGGR